MGVKSRVTRNLYATGFGQAVNVLTQLAGVPLFLHFWGVEKYGQWLVLSTIPTYLVLSEFGFSSVAASDMSMSVARGSRADAIKTFQSTIVVMLAASAISGLIVAGVYLLLTRSDILPVPATSGNEVAVVIAVFWGYVVIAQMTAVADAGYRCDGNFALGTFLYNVARLSEFAASAVCLFAGGGFVAVALSALAIKSVGACAMAVVLRRRSPWLSFGLRRVSRREIKRLVRPAAAYMAFPLGNAMSIQGFVLVVGWLVGGPGVVLFSTYRTMTRFPLQLMYMISNSVWPELSRSFGAGDILRARKLHRMAVTSSVWIALIAMPTLFLLAGPILQLWTDGRIPFDESLFAILAAVVLADSVWFPSSVVAVSINKHKLIAAAFLLSTVGAVALSVPLGRLGGLDGVASALFVIDIVMSFVVLPKSMELTDDSLHDFAHWFATAPRKSIAAALRWSH